jgi:hypothetical protein
MTRRALLWLLALCPSACIDDPWPPDTTTEIETFLGYETEVTTRATTGDTTGGTTGTTCDTTGGTTDTTCDTTTTD